MNRQMDESTPQQHNITDEPPQDLNATTSTPPQMETPAASTDPQAAGADQDLSQAKHTDLAATPSPISPAMAAATYYKSHRR